MKRRFLDKLNKLQINENEGSNLLIISYFKLEKNRIEKTRIERI